MKKYWLEILRHALTPHPARKSADKLYRFEHKNDFFSRENLIVTIKTKHKHYTFGGPIYSAQVSLTAKEAQISKLHSSAYHKITWDKIKEIQLSFFENKGIRAK